MMMAVLGFASAYAGEHGEMIQFSEPSSPVTSSSNMSSDLNAALERLNPTPSNFKQAQMDLFAPIKNAFRPQDSLQGVMELPSRQSAPAPDKHTREMMDRRRNWAFTDLSDLYPEPKMEEMFGLKDYGADGKEKQDATAMEKYYKNLAHKQDPNQKRNQPGSDFNNAMLNGLNPYTGTFSPAGSLTPVISAFPEDDAAKAFLGLTGHDTDASEKNANLFGQPGVTPEGVEENLAAQKRLDDFKRLLDPTLPALKPEHVAGTGISLEDFTRQPNSTGYDPLKAAKEAAEPHRSAVNPVLGLIDPTAAALHSHVYDDPTAMALGLPNPLKPTAPPKPSETIKQMLDPFAAGMMKPKF